MSSRTQIRIELSRRYTEELQKQLLGVDGESLRPAENLGLEALSVGLDTLDLIRIHDQALLELLSSGAVSAERDGLVQRAASFFGVALAPIGSAHRAALRKTDGASRRHATIRLRHAQLIAARRRMKREIDRRRAVQKALESSERHYGQLLKKSHRMQEHLRRLSREILSAHEEERKKISRDLHDEIGQSLTAINVTLATLKQEATVNTAGLRKRIAGTQRLLDKSMRLIHQFALELRPPVLDDLGLIPALQAYSKGFAKRTSLPIHVTASAAVERLDSDKRVVIYRVAQEALTNVARHAEASKVDVTIRVLRDVVRVEIRDNGKSFPVERVLHARKLTRLGLLGMRERVEMVGGSFTVDSAPGKGTTVRAEIPLNDAPARSRRSRSESTK